VNLKGSERAFHVIYTNTRLTAFVFGVNLQIGRE